MAERVASGSAGNSASIREAVCVNTRKIFDSCKDKDCVEDLRVFPHGLLPALYRQRAEYTPEICGAALCGGECGTDKLQPRLLHR